MKNNGNNENMEVWSLGQSIFCLKYELFRHETPKGLLSLLRGF